jgi:hypothetical protein
MNITRTIAKNVADKLVREIDEKKAAAEKQADKLIAEFVESNTPKAVKEFMELHPGWCTKRHRRRVYGCPFYITAYEKWHQDDIHLDEATADEVTKHMHKAKELSELANITRAKIIHTLLSIKTYNRCKESFPEAYALLPEIKVISLPAVQVDSIRQALGITSPSIK